MSLNSRLKAFARSSNRAGSLPRRLRQRRFRIFEDLVNDLRATQGVDGPISVIDFGGTAEYWYQVYDPGNNPLNIQVTLVNLEFPSEQDPLFRYAEGDVRDLSRFRDNSFHFGFSNSMIEHVGDFSQQLGAVEEMKRVSVNLYLQTPNFWFLWEPHHNLPFIHWFEVPIRMRLIALLTRSTATKELSSYSQNPISLLSGFQLEYLFPPADYVLYRERILGLTKSFVVYSSKLSEGIR